MSPEQVYRLLDSAMGAVILHSNALMNHPDTKPLLRKEAEGLKRDVQKADARIAAAMGNPYPSHSPNKRGR